MTFGSKIQMADVNIAGGALEVGRKHKIHLCEADFELTYKTMLFLVRSLCQESNHSLFMKETLCFC